MAYKITDTFPKFSWKKNRKKKIIKAEYKKIVY